MLLQIHIQSDFASGLRQNKPDTGEIEIWPKVIH